MLPTCSTLYLQSTPSLTGSYTHGCSISRVWSLFANQLSAEWIFVCLLSQSICVRYRIYSTCFFSCLPVYIFRILFFQREWEHIICWLRVLLQGPYHGPCQMINFHEKIHPFFVQWSVPGSKLSIVQSGTNCLCTCWGLRVRAYSWVEESLTSSTD
jgi:hypothetical protein